MNLESKILKKSKYKSVRPNPNAYTEEFKDYGDDIDYKVESKKVADSPEYQKFKGFSSISQKLRFLRNN